MPKPGHDWWHVIISTHNSWLPGDNRGFRSREHKVHSSGDYKAPPPIEEHAGLRQFHKDRSGDTVVIPVDCRETVGLAFLEKLQKLDYRVLTIAVAATHAHWLAELPENDKKVRLIVGECKAKSSHAIRDKLPGRVWAYRGKNIRVKDRQHQYNTYRYILNQEDAWIWDYKKEEQ